MPWVYEEVPEQLRFPACRDCRNRLNVRALGRAIYWCGDCGAVFVARWIADEKRPATAEQDRSTG